MNMAFGPCNGCAFWEALVEGLSVLTSVSDGEDLLMDNLLPGIYKDQDKPHEILTSEEKIESVHVHVRAAVLH